MIGQEPQRRSGSPHLGLEHAPRRRANVFRQRERTKRKRLIRALIVVASLDAYLWWRYSSGRPLQLPTIRKASRGSIYLPGPLLIVAIGLIMALPLMTGRSPHITVYRNRSRWGSRT